MRVFRRVAEQSRVGLAMKEWLPRVSVARENKRLTVMSCLLSIDLSGDRLVSSVFVSSTLYPDYSPQDAPSAITSHKILMFRASWER